MYRFLKNRWDGYQRGRDSTNVYFKARTEVYRRDLLRGLPLLRAGQVFAPSDEVRSGFAELEASIRTEFPRREVFTDLTEGRLATRDGGLYLLFSAPLVGWLGARILVLIALLWDPRTRPDITRFWRFLRRSKAIVKTAATGMMPWGQPTGTISRYRLWERTEETRSLSE